MSGNQKVVNGIHHIIGTEEVSSRFKKLSFYFKNKLKSFLHNISVPTVDGGWKTINQKEDIEYNIVEHSTEHFQQAQGTPPTKYPLDTIFSDGLDEAAQQVLNGTANIPTSCDTITKRYIQSLKKDTQLEPITDTIPLYEIKKSI